MRKKIKEIPSQSPNFLTIFFYFIIGLASSVTIFWVFYFILRIDSTITTLIVNTANEPIYFWSYILLTLGTIILFGVNVSLTVYRFKRFGSLLIKQHTGTGLGALVGVFASACPICSSTLLSLIGITSGLAIFPLQGLELKALSFIFMIFSVWLILKDLKNPKCDKDGVCPAPKDASFKANDFSWIITSIVVILFISYINFDMLQTDTVIAESISKITKPLGIAQKSTNSTLTSTNENQLYNETLEKVIPEKGFQSKIVLGDAVIKLVEGGVIDKEKFEALYKDRGGFPEDLKDILTKPSNKPILLTRNNANFYLNLLWALGLSNYMSTNKESPVNGASLFNFASTGGWTLGKEQNGGSYFNKLNIVPLSNDQEALATKIGKSTYRPCCNNSSFFQDCNHGSALLGVLELGAKQGLKENELYKEALAFNSFWFQQNYIEMALYFKVIKKIDWEKVDPKVALGFDYSSASGWNKSVRAEIQKIPNLIPQTKGGAGCGV